jgi:GNAT superfamily N-acetyltransferase
VFGGNPRWREKNLHRKVQSRGISVRRAKCGDARRIAALSTQLGYATSKTAQEARLASLLTNRQHLVLVAETSSAGVVAWIHAFVRRLVESDPHVEIGGLVVDERFRARGIGALLLRRAEKWARKNNLPCIYLRTNIIRKDAHAFYEKLGYKRIKTQHTYQKKI